MDLFNRRKSSMPPSEKTERTTADRTPMFSDGDIREALGFDRDDTSVKVKRLPGGERIDVHQTLKPHPTEDTFDPSVDYDYPFEKVTAAETEDVLDRLTADAIDAVSVWMYALTERVRRG